MEMTLNNGFCEMKDEELEIVDGGFGWIGYRCWHYGYTVERM